MVEVRDKTLIRSVVRRVHPDLFASDPYECATNSESLKALNGYVDALTRRMLTSMDSRTLVFYVREGEKMQKISAELPANGSLGPLFYAFGLISKEDLLSGQGSYSSQDDDTNFLEWLQETVQDAVRTSDYHDSLKERIRELTTSLESKFALGSVQFSGGHAMGSMDQLRQIESIKVLDAALTMFETERGNPQSSLLSGLNIMLYHPDIAPMETFSYMSASIDKMRSHISKDGMLHLLADRAIIRSAIKSLDISRAQLLTRLTRFWLQRVQKLTPAVTDLLRVESVWADTRTETGSQKFVLWAGALLEHRHDFEAVLPPGREFSFSILVHCDPSGPMVDFLASSCVLQVRADSPPNILLDYLRSEAAKLADEAAASVTNTREMEDELLAEVRNAFNAKHVIRVCSMLQQEKVLDGARRLLANAESIKQAVDLTGASIALDDCYELWDSGFISIPYDFSTSDLTPQLRRMLNSGEPEPAAVIDSVPEVDAEVETKDEAEMETEAQAHAEADVPEPEPASAAVNGSANGHSGHGNGASHDSDDEAAGGSNADQAEDAEAVPSARRSAETGAPMALPPSQHQGFGQPARPPVWQPRQPAAILRRPRRPAVLRSRPLAAAAMRAAPSSVRLLW
mmetsp:Transcript_35180/g.90006  ORF Transcript_35180/g.90006 Transcript_35180/m.90006 type:complete len:629 (+) Transcript_35180:339-2225(+)